MVILKAFIIRILTTILLVLSLSLASADTKSDQSAQLTAPPTAMSDAETQRLLQSILKKSDAFKGVTTSVDSGVVLIEGNLPTKKDADWLTETANKLPYTVGVINKTEIRTAVFSDFDPMWREFHKLSDRLKQMLPSILVAILFLLLFYFISSGLYQGVRRLWSRKISNPFLLSIVTRITLLPIWLMLFYFALRLLGLSTLGVTLVGGTSVLGIILGLSFKGIAENYLAGLLLASRSPFTRGDLIKIGDHKGYVQNLNMRGTTIIDMSGNLILIPNLTVIQSVVENQSANPNTRTAFTVGIGYHNSISRAQNLIIEAVKKVEGVLTDPAPSVVVTDLGSTRVELTVRVWFNVKEHREMRVKSRAMVQAKETLLANGFSIPNETRELIFANTLKIENVQEPTSAEVESEARKVHIKEQAENNLAEPESSHAARDPSPEEMLELAEKNPLPMNTNHNDLLKNSIDVRKSDF